jgi:hypothetical protein
LDPFEGSEFIREKIYKEKFFDFLPHEQLKVRLLDMVREEVDEFRRWGC